MVAFQCGRSVNTPLSFIETSRDPKDVTWRKLYRQAGDEVNQWESLTGAKVIDFRTESTDKEGCSSGARKLSTPLLMIFCQRTVEELKCRAGIKPIGRVQGILRLHPLTGQRWLIPTL
jgi:hypothetical protein